MQHQPHNRPTSTSRAGVAGLLADLTSRGIELEARGDRLRYRPRSKMTPDLTERLKVHKLAILAAVRAGWLPQAPQDRSTTNATPKVSGDGQLRTPPDLTADVPHELSLAERIATGHVNVGWTPSAWANRLLDLAERCQATRPEVAAQYRTWAANVREKA